jgi:hypothetical protein
MQGKQTVHPRRQPPDVVLVVILQLEPQPGGEVLQEEKHEEAAGFLILQAQLHHLRQKLGGATVAQKAHGQQQLNPLVLGEGMMLHKVFLQMGVRLVIVCVALTETFRYLELCSTCLKESLGRSKHETNLSTSTLTHCVGFLLYPSLTEPSSIE